MISKHGPLYMQYNVETINFFKKHILLLSIEEFVFICIAVCYTCKNDNLSRGRCSIAEGLLSYIYWL